METKAEGGRGKEGRTAAASLCFPSQKLWRWCLAEVSPSAGLGALRVVPGAGTVTLSSPAQGGPTPQPRSPNKPGAGEVK